ncbi:MAG: TonB-dependent receptor [Bacteroidales bacterium]|nr:TonB-dependent receptor [Bacteroidales bacterium]
MSKLLLTFAIFIIAFSVSFAQDVEIRGTVSSSENNEPLIGATVVVKGTTKGTVTDLNGEFKINVPTGSVLVFSYVGFKTNEITISSQTELNIDLKPEAEALDEIVVIGYGQIKKADLSSSIATMDSKEVLKAPGGVLQGMNGKVAGVQIADENGDAKIRIRGEGSINNTDPLIIVDGLIGTNLPNENDLESIQILKDAASCAIYGARGANGVIIATTKKGKKGGIKIDYNGFTGSEEIDHTIEVLPAKDLALLINEARYNDNKTNPRYSDFYADPNSLGTGTTNMQDIILQTAHYQNHNLSVSGGSENLIFRLSGNYNTNNTVNINSGRWEKYSLLTNSTFTKGRLKIGETIKFGKDKWKGQNRDNQAINNLVLALMWPSTIIPYDTTGTEETGFSVPTFNSDSDNPLVIAYNNPYVTETNYFLEGTIWAEIELLKGLTYKFNAGFKNANKGVQKNQVGFFANKEETLGNFSENYSNDNTLILEHTLNYNQTFGKHLIAGVIGYTTEENYHKDFTVSAPEGLKYQSIQVVHLGKIENLYSANEGIYEDAMMSYLGRVNYIYNDRWILTANVRSDASAKFGPAFRWGTFPSFSAAWKISEQDFLRNSAPFISTLKIRGGYGTIGNSNIDRYQYDAAVNIGPNIVQQWILQYHFGQYGDSTMYLGALPLKPANKAVKWEKSYQTDIGIDLGLFEEKISLIIDYYDNTTKDMLVEVPLSYTNGFFDAAPFLNAGSIKNKGWEFTLAIQNTSGNFNYKVSSTLSTVKNEVISLGGGKDIYAGKITDFVTVTREGNSIGEFYGYKTNGLYKTQEEIDAQPYPGTAKIGDIRFVDIDGNDTINENDKVPLGPSIPKFSGGFTVNLGYKTPIGEFDLATNWIFVYGNKLWNNAKTTVLGMKTNYGESLKANDRFRETDLYWYYDAATKVGKMYDPATDADAIAAIPDFYQTAIYLPKNTDTDLPRASLIDQNKNIVRPSDYFLEDGSFLRLQYLTLGYSLPKNLLHKIKVDNVRVYVGGKNLLTFTKYSGYNPDFNSSATSGRNQQLERGINYHYPWNRTFITTREYYVGIQVAF